MAFAAWGRPPPSAAGRSHACAVSAYWISCSGRARDDDVTSRKFVGNFHPSYREDADSVKTENFFSSSAKRRPPGIASLFFMRAVTRWKKKKGAKPAEKPAEKEENERELVRL